MRANVYLAVCKRKIPKLFACCFFFAQKFKKVTCKVTERMKECKKGPN